MFIGIDIGATNTRIVASESLDDLSTFAPTTFPTNHNFEAAIAEVIKAINQTADVVTRIGIGLPGSVSDDGILTGSFNLSSWVDQPLKASLEAHCNCEVVVKNDAEMGALGEAHYGEHGQHDFFYLTWGTGLGCAQIEWRNRIAEVSRPDDRQQLYSFEELVGGINIGRRFGKPASELTETEWELVYQDFVRELPGLITGYGYDRVVFGGGIAARRKEELLNATKDIDIEVLVTNLGDEIGLYGALAALK